MAPKTIPYAQWASSIFQSLVNFTPLAALPAYPLDAEVHQRHPPAPPPPPSQIAVFKGCRAALVASFIALNLLPGTLPRYSLPAAPLSCLLLGWTLAEHHVLLATDRLWRAIIMIGLLLISAVSISAVILNANPNTAMTVTQSWRLAAICLAALAATAAIALNWRALQGRLAADICFGNSCGRRYASLRRPV